MWRQELRLLAGGALFAVHDSPQHAAFAAADAADAIPKVYLPSASDASSELFTSVLNMQSKFWALTLQGKLSFLKEG